MIKLIEFLYAISGIIIVVSYIPQVIRLIKDINLASGLSLFTWAGWLSTAVISVLYGFLVIKDNLFIYFSLGNILGCSAVFSIIVYHRLIFNKKNKH